MEENSLELFSNLCASSVYLRISGRSSGICGLIALRFLRFFFMTDIVDRNIPTSRGIFGLTAVTAKLDDGSVTRVQIGFIIGNCLPDL